MAAGGDTNEDKELLKLQLQYFIEQEKTKRRQEKEQTKRERAQEKTKREEQKTKRKEIDHEIEQEKTKQIRITQGLSSSSLSYVSKLITNHSNYYNLCVIGRIHSFDINNVLNDNNCLNDNTIELIRKYINDVSPLSNMNE
ncbi:unnamed protein product [Rotaria sordida]|uniref:Uncharacterized protein n=1 Tax=Rotaria sordida TaxID=392033 RepID=A0A815GH03_9BILA|nr:unnamed protein product [Rotaria sordida]CAF1338176.1 unnamed protein product [Rotaria sordida]CAF3800643.1 unnamed protein product [Rotaria sordida]CAF4071179.1 unnamed protein product [Rotaria sordida]